MFRSGLILFLVALYGCGVILGSPVQTEEYLYKSTIRVGVLNPRQSTSGSAINMRVKVSRAADQSAQVTFSQVKTNHFNRMARIADQSPDFQQNVETPVPQLEGSFKVYLNRERGTVMEVPTNEAMWITNIRKAIVSMLKVPPYLGQRQQVYDVEQNSFNQRTQSDEERSIWSAYQKTENIFAGRCNVSYTMTRDERQGRFPQSPSSALPSGGNYYRLRRSIDFDSCHNPVSLDKTSFGNFSTSYKSQFLYVQERSTDAEYVLREKGDGFFDIRGVVQVSEQFTKPFGLDSGRILAHTNQTLILQSISRGSGQQQQVMPSSGLKPVTTWLHQFKSPAQSTSQHKSDFVIYAGKQQSFEPINPEYVILGEQPISQDQIKSKLSELLDKITNLQESVNDDYRESKYNGTKDGRVTQLMNQASWAIQSLNLDSVRSFWKKTESQQSPRDMIKRQSFIDASAASGSSAAIKAFIENAQQHKIDRNRTAGFFTTLTNNIRDPEAMKDLMEYVMTITPERDGMVLTSQSHLNFARLAQRVCVNSDLKRYTVPQPLLGKKTCERSMIEQRFVPHLEQLIKNSRDTWSKILYTLSLGNLGLDSTAPFIKEVVLGKFGDSRPLRIGAVRALQNLFQDKNNRQAVVRALLPLAEDHRLEHPIREAAFITLVKSRPNETFYQRFAMNTWRDPSSKMRDLISSTFVSLAQSDAPEYARQSAVVRKLLPVMRPSQPSASSSASFNYRVNVPDYKISAEFDSAWIQEYNSMLSIPRKMLHALKGDFGGVEVPLYEMFTQRENTRISGSQQQQQMFNRDSRHVAVHRELDNLHSAMNQDMKESQDDVYVYLSMLNYQSFMPYDSNNRDAIKSQLRSFLTAPHQQKGEYYNSEHMVKYFNPVDIYSVLPTPFGIPSEIKMVTPSNHVFKTKIVQTSDRRDACNITVDGISKMILKTQSLVTVQMPWLKKQATAGFDTEATISTDGLYSVEQNTTYPFPITRFTISPRVDSEKPFLYARSKPMSLIQTQGPVTDMTAPGIDLVVPVANVSQSYNATYQVPMRYLGLKARFTWQADLDFPFQQSNVINMIQKPERLLPLLTTPTPQDFTFAYRVDMRQSETRNISMAAIIDFGYNSHQFSEKSAPLSQIAQRIAQKAAKTTSPEELATEARRGELGNFLVSLQVNYTVPNVRTRHYHFQMTGSNLTTQEGQFQKELVAVNLIRKGLPGDQGDRKTCACLSLQEKKRPQRSNPEKSELYTELQADIYAGKQCSDNEKVVQTKADLYYEVDDRSTQPEQGRRRLQFGLFTDPSARIPWIQDGIYDKINVQVRKMKELPEYFKNYTMMATDLAEGYSFPYLVKNRQVSQPNYPGWLAVFNITRNVQGGTWSAWINQQDQIGRVQDMPVYPIIDWASPILGSRQRFRHQYQQSSASASGLHAVHAISRDSDKICKVQSETVKTFDGVRYEKQRTGCWQLAAYLYHQDESFTVQTRSVQQDQEEVKILVPGLPKIEIKPGQEVLINGKQVRRSAPITSSSGREVGRVEVLPMIVSVKIENMMEVDYIDNKHVVILVDEKYRKSMSGLCGDFNGEEAADLKSPRGCVFAPSQGKVFAASWLPEGTQCQEQSMQSYIRQAKEVERSSCKKSLSIIQRSEWFSPGGYARRQQQKRWNQQG